VLGEDDKHERLLAVWIKKRTLGAEVKNLEVKVRNAMPKCHYIGSADILCD
jgi:hypothetical protein